METANPVWIYAARITPELIKIGRSKHPEKRIKELAANYSLWLGIPRSGIHLLWGLKMPNLKTAIKAETLLIDDLTSRRFDYIGREAYYCSEEDCMSAMLGAVSHCLGKVTRDQMNRWCGPRDGSRKPDTDKEQG